MTDLERRLGDMSFNIAHRLPLVGLFAVWVLLLVAFGLLASCQTIEQHCDGSAECRIEGQQERGGQQTDAINPDVDTGDVGGLPGLP